MAPLLTDTVRDSTSLPSDKEIVAAVLRGERDEFAVIVRRYYGSFLRTALSRLGCRPWAEDAVQEAFMCAFKSLHSYNGQHSFRTWLWTILLNQCRRQYQNRMKSPLAGYLADANEIDIAGFTRGDSPDARLLSTERQQTLETVLQTIPANQAEALRLRFFGELKFQEIADAMGCSLSSAKNRVKWGLAKMTQLLQEKDIQI